MPKLFEIVTQSAYSIELKKIENMEDAGDEFFTEEELVEMGVARVYSGTHVFRSKIVDEILKVKASIKEGKKSAIIHDEELVEALKRTYDSCSDFVPHTRRVGNRLFYEVNVKASQTAPTYANWKTLVYKCLRMACEEFESTIRINMNEVDRVKLVDMFKKMFEWEQIQVQFDNTLPDTDGDVVWCKAMWEDSKLIPLVASKKG